MEGGAIAAAIGGGAAAGKRWCTGAGRVDCTGRVEECDGGQLIGFDCGATGMERVAGAGICGPTLRVGTVMKELVRVLGLGLGLELATGVDGTGAGDG